MVARSGLGVVPVPGSPPVGMSAADHRLILGAQFGTTAQCLAGGSFTPSSTTMAFTSTYSVWAVPDNANAGAVYHAGVDPTTITPAAGPASGSRIDSIYVIQNDYEKGASDSRVSVGLQAGTASSTPTPPTIPSGAVRIANITVPANVTKASDCTLSYVIPPTAIAEPAILAPSKALLDLVPGAFLGQRSFAAGIDYRWNGAVWKPRDSDWITYTPFMTQISYGSYTARYRYVGGLVRVSLSGIVNAIGASTAILGLPVAADITNVSQVPVGRAFFKSADGVSILDVDLNFSDANSVLYTYLTQVNPPRAAYLTPAGGGIAVGWQHATTFDYAPG